MAYHAGAVTVEELDQIVIEEIGNIIGKPVEVRVYRESCNTSAQVLCNGMILSARSNCQLKEKILKMKRKGTLVSYFKQPTLFQEDLF